MSQDTPRKTITITRKPSPAPTAAPSPENAPKAITRPGKRIIADLHLSASKRVVQKLMHYHTHNRDYLQAIQHGGNRSNLDGTDGGAILPFEREHAARALAEMPGNG